MLVSAITASNASFFPEYVLPNVRYLTRDPDVMVRVVFAQCIVPLAETAIQFLEMGQAVKAHGTVKSKEAKELNAVFDEVCDGLLFSLTLSSHHPLPIVGFL